MPRYKVLDSWRGICACMVALMHFPTTGLLSGTELVRNGYLFVDFFFVLSGFVIHGTYRNRLTDKFAGAGFMITRFGRLYPLHLFTLLCVLVLELAQHLPGLNTLQSGPPFSEQSRSIPSFFSNLFLVDSLGIHAEPAWNAPSWSISAEFWAYLFFAVFTLALGRRAIYVAIAMCVVLPYAIGILSPMNMDATADYGMLRCIFGFSAGMIAFELHDSYSGRISLTARQSTALEVIAVLGVGFFVSSVGISVGSLFAPFVFLIAILVFAREGGKVSQVLLTPFPLLLGALSYSIYMTHWTIHGVGRAFIGLAERVFDYPLISERPYHHSPGMEAVYGNGWFMGEILTFAMLGVVIAVSYLTYRFVETPWRKKFRKWGRSIEQSEGEVVLAPAVGEKSTRG